MRKIIIAMVLFSAEFGWATVGKVTGQVAHPTYTHSYVYH